MTSKFIKLFLLFLLSIAAGIVFWLVSVHITGTMEPWDSPWGILYLLVAGFGFGFLGYEKPWLWPLGLYLGQFIYCASTFMQSLFSYSSGGVNMFFPLGMIFLIPYSLLALVGSILASKFSQKIRS